MYLVPGGVLSPGGCTGSGPGVCGLGCVVQGVVWEVWSKGCVVWGGLVQGGRGSGPRGVTPRNFF